MRFLLIISFLLSSTVYADNICELDDFRKDYPAYCEKGDWYGYNPTQQFHDLAGGGLEFDRLFRAKKVYKDSAKANELMTNFEIMVEKKLQKTEAGNVDVFNEFKSQTALLSTETRNHEVQVTKAKKTIDDTDSLKEAYKNLIKEKGSIYQDILTTDGHPNPTCMRDPSCSPKIQELFSLQSKEINDRELQVAYSKTMAKKLTDKNKKAIDELAKAHSGAFEKLAMDRIKKADPDLGITDPKKIKEACQKATETGSPAADVCKKLAAEIDKIKLAKRILKNAKNKISKSKNLLDLLSLKLNLDGLKADQKKIAAASMLPDINKKLQGTVLGSIMDQMREDMCNVAQNPKFMCTGTAFGFAPLVNNSGSIIKEVGNAAKDKFQSRAVGSTKE